jgi:hypothetical protein
MGLEVEHLINHNSEKTKTLILIDKTQDEETLLRQS